MKCQDCYFNEWSEFPRVFIAKAYKKAKILFISKSPKSIEDEQFYETERMDLAFEKSGIDPEDCEYAFIIQCSQKSQEFLISDRQLLDNSGYCQDTLESVIAMVDPKAIVVLGKNDNLIFASVTGDKDYLKNLIKPFKTFYKDKIPVYHAIDSWPRQDNGKDGIKDNKLISTFMQVKSEILDAGSRDSALNYKIVNSDLTRENFLNWFETATEFAFDIETSTGEAEIYVDTYKHPCTIYTLAIGDDTIQWVIPVDLKNFAPGLWKSSQERQSFFDRLFELGKLPNKYAIGQNGKFDNKYLEYVYGGCFTLQFDTMLAHHLLDENTTSGLKDMAAKFLNAPDYDIPKPIDFTKNSPSEVMKYNAWDVYYTFKLFKLFRAQLMEDLALARFFTKVTMPAARALHQVERTGIYVDSNKLKQNYNDIKKEVFSLEKKLTNISSINWNSTKQLGELFFSETNYNLEPVMYTKTNKPSVAEAALKIMLDTYSDKVEIVDIIETLLTYRRKLKLTQFLSSWEDYLDEEDRMHPKYLLHGTVTGRLSCKDPNLQQVPRDILARSCITAPDGFILGEVDYSQIELRVAAELSGDQQMQMCFNTGVDIHRLTASRAMGVDPETVSKADRKKAKAINFGFLYGMGAKKFKEYARDKYEVHISDEEAKSFRKRFFALYSSLQTWHARQIKLAHQFGMIRNKLGRIRHLAPDIYSDDSFTSSQAERASINSPVQSFASDMTQISLARITNELPHDKIRVVGTVHDSILFEVREDSLELCDKVYDITTNLDYIRANFGVTFNTPIDVEIKLGPWGLGEVYEPHK